VRRRLALFLGIGALLITLAPATQAHDLGVARVVVEQLPGGRVLLSARSAAEVELAAPELPPRFELDGVPVLRREGVTWLHSWAYASEGAPLQGGDALRFPWPREGAFVRLRSGEASAGRYFPAADGAVQVELAALTGEGRGLGATLGHYGVLGVEHILLGWDHLAFVLCLCLAASGWRLVRLVTAFTLGHSLTLAAAVLGWTNVPSAPVEACIALSIVVVAREALVHGRAMPHGGGLVAAFGLLHGLGFAGALSEVGISDGELLPGLLAFNLGVELGQLAFVAVALLLAAAAVRLAPRAVLVAPQVARVLGAVALFWTLERAGAILRLASGGAA